jgi:prepilin-type N-terminal cleavage/methylation domain-containing protein
VSANSRTSCRAEAGFTLLELLVTLVLVGLLTTLLAQTLWMSFDMLQRAREQAADIGRRQMQMEWFRMSVQAMQPDADGGRTRFHGGPRTFTSLTAAAPADAEGAMRRVKWELVLNRANMTTELVATVAPADEPFRVLTWEGDSGTFEYSDDDGKRYDAWPPPLGARMPQLPRAVALKMGTGSEQTILYAVAHGARDAPVDLVRMIGRPGS